MKKVNAELEKIRDDEFINEIRKQENIILNLLVDFFKDEDKATTWFVTQNPLLGNSTPCLMIFLGRFEKLHKFVTAMLEENNPPCSN
jgi:hypothetical protein